MDNFDLRKYLSENILLKEEAEERVKITVGFPEGNISYKGQLGRDPSYDLYHFKPEEGGFEFIPNDNSKSDSRDWVNNMKEKFNSLIGKELEIDYDFGPSIKLGGEPNPGSMYIPGLIHGDQDVKIKKT